MTARRPGRSFAAGLLALAVFGGFAGRPPTARAETADDCPTWFPDFRCERSGRWDGFEMPLVDFALFEDPFITTGIYPYYAYHEFPNSSALQGGHAHDVSVQARVALTDRLALIATKDGRMWLRSKNELLPNSEGWLNIAGGLKYAILQRPDDEFILSGILRLEFPWGSSDVFQGGGGKPILLPSIALAKGFGNAHVIADLGGQAPFDDDINSSSIFYHLYLDYEVMDFFQPFVQLNGIHYVDSGDGNRKIRLVNGARVTLNDVQTLLGTGGFEGFDLMNLGSRGVSGNDVLTWAVGTHIPISRQLTFSVAYERHLTSRKDIFQQRVTTLVRLEF